MTEGLRLVADQGRLPSSDPLEAIQVHGIHLAAFGSTSILEEAHTGAANTRYSRWLRHFCSTRLPEPTLMVLRQIFGHLTSAWSTAQISEDVQESFSSIADVLANVVLKNSQILALQPSRPLVGNALSDMSRICAGITQATGMATGIASSDSLMRLVWHEALRELGDRLISEDDLATLFEIFEEAGLVLSAGGHPVFADLPQASRPPAEGCTAGQTSASYRDIAGRARKGVS
eukprot:CAMPEP_0115372970 /NCGR_PEP_ID=MMETSP0271-20121206/1182_1 /TAXON_ID=71861 /ORGANISM="Scrippsiella trochoidea, Strain CCMP3099" /LENGTH=231 /DNA_ID=CAMNT_0002795941 /DNA_START=42 /DNA_END=734 /DNA_ORIENTATION=+